MRLNKLGNVIGDINSPRYYKKQFRVIHIDGGRDGNGTAAHI